MSDGEKKRLRAAAVAHVVGNLSTVMLVVPVFFDSWLNGLLSNSASSFILFALLSVIFLAELLALTVVPQRPKWPLVTAILVGAGMFASGLVFSVHRVETIGLLVALLPFIKLDTWTQEWMASLDVHYGILWVQWRTLP